MLRRKINFFVNCSVCSTIYIFYLYRWICAVPRYGRYGLWSTRRWGGHYESVKSFAQDMATRERQDLGRWVMTPRWAEVHPSSVTEAAWHWKSVTPISGFHGNFFFFKQTLRTHYTPVLFPPHLSTPLNCELLWKQELWHLSRVPGIQHVLFFFFSFFFFYLWWILSYIEHVLLIMELSLVTLLFSD